LELGLMLHVIHVSGRRMIAQGTDGLSRADHSRGVMQGRAMTAYVPLHIDPLDREPRLKGWLEDVTRSMCPTFLRPSGWYEEGHGLGTFIWTPPPAAAEVVVEQLGLARMKRPEAMHIVAVPRVMTGRWRKHLTRGTDFYLKVDWSDVWPLDEMFEPLLIFVCVPYRTDDPKLEERAQLLEDFRGELLRDNVRSIPAVQRRHLLRKFLLRARALCPV
jgi:hypothetical protein